MRLLATEREHGGHRLRNVGGTLLVLAAIQLASACSVLLPSAPTAVSAWSGDASAFLRWSAPATRGIGISGYTITPVVAGVAQAARSFAGATGTGTFTGLANGSVVTFRIAAVNAAGVGPAAETKSVTIGHDPLTSSSSWLDVVNYTRQSAGEPLVSGNAGWTTGLQAHYRYLANTPASQRSGQYASAHTENPASAWYTAAGQAAGASADLLSSELGSPLANIDGWLDSPFHAIGLIRPDLQASAYAAGSGDAGIDVIRGVDQSLPAATHPVLLPGPGAITTSRSYSGAELPSPLQSCPGFTSAGLPIVALLPTAPPTSITVTLRQPDGTLLRGASLCVITARNFRSTDKVYGPAGLSMLEDSHAVIIVPKTPLQLGSQTVTLSPAGSPTVSWTFSVAGA